MPSRPKQLHPHAGFLAAGLLAVLLIGAYLASDAGLSRILLKPVAVPAVSQLHVQHRDLDFNELRQLDSDLLVIDPDAAGLTPAQLAVLKQHPNGGQRLVLAHLNIGQAEDYRPYWQYDWRPGQPPFIQEADSQWPGRYRIAFWDRGWRRAISRQAADLAEAGYDGAFLDSVEAYREREIEDPGAAEDMVGLVKAIRAKARQRNPEFLIVPSGAPELYENRRWPDLIDGLANEETWFKDGHRRPPTDITIDIAFLDRAAADGKIVLSLEYPTSQSAVCAYYRLCRQKGYLCAAGRRALDQPDMADCSE